MPSSSEQQRKFVYAKRNQYGSKEDTPDKWKWVWSDDWLTVKKENRIKKYKPLLDENYYIQEIYEAEAKTVDGYLSPAPGDLPEKGVDILAKVYAKCRADGGDKTKCSKISWNAVHKAGY